MEALTRTIEKAVQENDYTTLTTVFSDHGGAQSWQSVGQGEQRSLAATLIQAVVASPTFLPKALEHEHTVQVMVHALGHLPATPLENAADNVLREKLFESKIAEGEYGDAARILAGMRMEDNDVNSVYSMTPASKTGVFVKIAECFLEEGEIAEADSAVNKAGVLVETIPDKDQHMALILRYKSTYARVLDRNRKFLAAALRLAELSQLGLGGTEATQQLLDADDLLQMLGMAATCAILAPSGPQRQRVLGHIYHDERLKELDSLPKFATHSAILTKMYTNQIIRPHELVQFEASLEEHQKAVMGDGLTIMERGVVEHNMIAVSSLYRSIYMTELARILGVTATKAEKTAASMIMDGTVHGSIDQVEGLLEFDYEESPEQTWDRSLSSFFLELNRVTDAVKAASAEA